MLALFGSIGFEASLTDDGIATEFEGHEATYPMTIRVSEGELWIATSFPFSAPRERHGELKKLAARLRLQLHPARFDICPDTGRIQLQAPHGALAEDPHE